MNWTARPLLHRGVVVNISKSTINNYVNCIPSTSPWETHRRNMAERASGPGGLFKSSRKTINPWSQEQKASRLRLYRARLDLEERLHPTKEESKFEDEYDITNIVESQIEEMMRRGGFDNLRNKGRPLPQRPKSTMEVAMRIMRENGLRPRWLQLMHDIDGETKCLRLMLVRCLRCKDRKKGDWELAKRVLVASVKDINVMIDSFNLSRPFSFGHLFRLRLRVGYEIGRAFKKVATDIENERKQREEKEEAAEEGKNDDDVTGKELDERVGVLGGLFEKMLKG